MELSYEKYVGAIFDGRYRIEKVIGLGGMAVVFKAVDIMSNKVVALKLLREDMAQEEESVKRFINESKAVAMLSHPNIVKIFAVSVKEDHKYIVMEYIEGITLKTYMQKKKILTTGEILNLTKQILNALDHAHQKGIVHRDIKPQNIMLLKSGQIKVTDFGIAKLPNAETVTMTDKAIGTVFYISPEQASGQPIDVRSDLYSLGVSMYEMATGELPFNAENPVSVALMQVNDTPIAPREINPDIPEGLEQIIVSAMEKNPEERYQSAAEMLQNVQKLLENPKATFKNPHKKEAEPKGFKGVVKELFNTSSMLPIVLGVFVPFLIIFIIAGAILFTNFINPSDENSKVETITVPEFAGKYYTPELAAWFESSDIYKLEIKYQYDTEYENGYIISQTPKKGAKRKVEPGVDFCEITLTVSGSAGDIKIPTDLVAKDYRSVEIDLKKLGIKYVIEEVNDNIYGAGQVIKTSPAGGEILSDGQTLTVYVSLGADTGDIEVPDLVGKSESKALALILDAGLRQGNVTYERSDKTAGTVISQSIEAETKVVENTKIDLVVSGGANYDPNKGFETETETTKADDTSTKNEETSKKDETSESTSADTSTDESSSDQTSDSATESSSAEETSANVDNQGEAPDQNPANEANVNNDGANE